jgi:hypothetical protein
MSDLEKVSRMSQELYGKSLRWMSAAVFSFAMMTAACTPAAMAQSPAEPGPEFSYPTITVQIAPPPISISSAMLGISSPLGAQTASGKPISAEFITEHHQSFTDGNHISHSTTSSIYRDTQGRIRRESQLSLPGMPAGVAASTFITIVDQKLGYGYVLNPQEMVAHRYDLNGSRPSYMAHLNAQGTGSALLAPSGGQTTAGSTAETATPAAAPSNSRWRLRAFSSHRNRDSAPAANTGAANSLISSNVLPDESGFASAPNMRIDQPFLAAPNPVRTENLGEQTILGFRARGTRVITTLPAGQIGNERPINIVSEQWFSPELEVVMRSMHRDPWAGEFTTTITKISRGDQPEWLFEIPEHYKVIDAASEDEHHVLDGHGNHAPGPAPW